MAKLRVELYSRTNQIIIDGVIFALSFALAYAIRFEGVPEWAYVKQFALWLPYLIAFRLYINWKLGIYRFIWRYVSLSDAIAITRSIAIVTGFLLAVRLLYPPWAPLAPRFKISLTVIALEFLMSLLGCLGARALRRILYQRQEEKGRDPRSGRRLLLIGAGRAGVTVASELAPRSDVRLVGFLDDDPKKIGRLVNGVAVLGPLDMMSSVVYKHEVEEVVICIPRAQRATLKKLWALAENTNVRMKIVPTLEEILHGKVNIASFRDVQMADLLGRETVDFASGGADIAPVYRGKRILITGAGGSIGGELAIQLMEVGPQRLVLLDKDENGLNDVYIRVAANSDGHVAYPVVADIRSVERLRGIFETFQPEIVFHAAAHKHVPLMEMNPCEAILNNVGGTRNLVELSKAGGVSRFIFISTDKAVKPVSVMGASKRVCELIVQTRGCDSATRFACVRFGNVMGSRGSVIPFFQQQIARGGPVTVTHPEVQRFLMTIPEAVRLVIQAGTLGASGEIFVLDMGDPIPILDLARDLIELSGLRLGHDIEIETTQLRPGEKLIEELIDSSSEKLALTSLEKIRVVQGPSIDGATFNLRLGDLEEAARCQQPQRVYEVLRKLNIGFNPAAAPLTGGRQATGNEAVSTQIQTATGS
ncbi:MAG: polysaccharide biosynthesis protein [Acidobacteria bacterium]|nr:polysaccharide biosynthesis protein [Acidobacteriota bacterium]